MSGMWKTVNGFPKEPVHKKVEHPLLMPFDLANKCAPLKDMETYNNKKWKKQNDAMSLEYSLHPRLMFVLSLLLLQHSHNCRHYWDLTSKVSFDISLWNTVTRGTDKKDNYY